MTDRLMRFFVTCAVLVAFGNAVAPANAADASREAIAAILNGPDPLVLDGITLDGPHLRALYESYGGSAIWHKRVDHVTAVLRDAGGEGLDPAAYHLTAIAQRQADRTTEGASALDVLVSDAVLRYATDVRYGRSRPHLTAEIAFERPPDPVWLVQTVIAASDVEGALRALAPTQPQYVALRKALADHRAMLEAGKRWPIVPDGPTIRPGTMDPAVPALRARLEASGEYTGAAAATSRRYDPQLVDAVRTFQSTHGLAADGAVGKSVRAALNAGLATRIEQIVVNMERWRWLPEDLGSKRVMVNVASARVRMIEDGHEVFEGPVIVGETDKRTPMFSSAITHVIFNPSWTVPDKIARKELLPKVQRDRSYFARQGIRLIGNWHPGGSEDDPNWGGAHGASGFRLRQAPGPQNPLGRVKFQIPNVFGVYMHDTSNRNLFAREKRTLSHGCVRVGKALDFAEFVLAGVPSWSEARRERILADWNTTTIVLPTPIPVHLMYETAWVDEAGRTHFLDDVYGRDRRLADALVQGKVEVDSEPVETAEP
jgi:murein L,D-transpeptidase YcbB/YkuD